MKTGGKGGGWNALLRMGFRHFYHLYQILLLKFEKNIRWISGNLETWKPGNLEIWNSEALQKNSFSEFQFFRFSDSQLGASLSASRSRSPWEA